jgi:hypothetical protein
MNRRTDTYILTFGKDLNLEPLFIEAISASDAAHIYAELSVSKSDLGSKYRGIDADTIRQAELSEKNKTLLLMGARTTGSFIEGYHYVEEELYLDEAKTIYEFCEHLDNNIGGAGRGNIEIFYKAFAQPNNEELASAANIKIKELEELKSIIG